MRRFTCFLILLLVFLSGCTEDSVSPTENEQVNYTVAIYDLPPTFAAVTGSEQQVSCRTLVRRESGEVAPGLGVLVSLSGIEANFRDSTFITDQNGYIDVSVGFTMPEADGSLNIRASVPGDEKSASVGLYPVARPENLYLAADNYIINAIPNENVAINIVAAVTDENGGTVAEVPLVFSIEPPSGLEAYGTITRQSTTDERGEVHLTFNSMGGYGSQSIRCEVGELKGFDGELFSEIDIQIKIPINANQLILTANPNYLHSVHPDSLCRSEVTARVVDENNNGLPGLTIYFDSDYGSIGGSGVTDEMGRAKTEFIFHPLSDEPDDWDGQIVIEAKIVGIDISVTTNITFESSQWEPGTLVLTSDRTYIYADNGLTSANIVAVLKDNDNQARAGWTVNFSADFGVVSPTAVTDDLGIARVVFKDLGIPSMQNGQPFPARIMGRVDYLSLSSAVEVYIYEKSNVSEVILRSARNQLNAGGADSTWVGATCQLEDGSLAPPGTPVLFAMEEENGHFKQDTVLVSGNSGSCENWFYSGVRSGTVSLVAIALNSLDETSYNTVSNYVDIDIIAGTPRYIDVTAMPDSLSINYQYRSSRISASIADTWGNPVEDGILVSFTTTLGNLDRSTNSTVDGKAMVSLLPGENVGIAQINATVEGIGGTLSDRTLVTFYSTGPNSILLSANPLQIMASEGDSTCIVRAVVRDIYGNAVLEENTVIFQMLGEPPSPNGCQFGGGLQIDSAVTVNGIAEVTLHSGTQSGGKLIRAYTWRDAERTQAIESRLSTFHVTSGIPNSIDFDIDNNGELVQGGWRLILTANVYDEWRNPVSDSTLIMFSTDPEIVHISNTVAGNGHAQTYLTYESVNTFDTLTVNALVEQDGSRITASRELVLPLNDGVLELNADPMNWRIDDPENPDTCLIRVWAILRDGHGVRINNAPILFGTTRAKYYRYNLVRRRYEQFYPNPAIAYTGWRGPEHNNEYNEEDGYATVYLRGKEFDFFLNPLDEESHVQLTARVEGYRDVETEPVVVVILREP